MTARDRARNLVDDTRFQGAIVAVILVNAALIGIEATPELMQRHGRVVDALVVLTLAIFTAEIAARMYAHGTAFFRSAWNLFDLAVVMISVIPGGAGYSLFRILRIFRVLRLFSTVRSMRRVVGALVATAPGMASIAALLGIVMYIASVLSTELFAETDPEHFGSLGTAFQSMFQITTGDDWAGVVHTVATRNSWAWVFFAVYVIIATYVVLNLFVAVAVEALDRQSDDAIEDAVDEVELVLHESLREVREELKAIRHQLELVLPARE